jgi:hypothetical protein
MVSEQPGQVPGRYAQTITQHGDAPLIQRTIVYQL